VKYVVLLDSPICPYELSPDNHTVPSSRIIAVFLSYPASINNAFDTSVSSLFNINDKTFEGVSVPLLNWPNSLYPDAYNLLSWANTTKFLKLPLIYFTFWVFSKETLVNIFLAELSPKPNCPFPLFPDVHNVPFSLTIAIECPKPATSFTLYPIQYNEPDDEPFPNSP